MRRVNSLAFFDGLDLDLNSGVQPASGKTILGPMGHKGKTSQRSKSVKGVGDKEGEADVNNKDEEVGGDVLITEEGSGSPLPPPDTFQLIFHKGKDKMVLVSDGGLKISTLLKAY